MTAVGPVTTKDGEAKFTSVDGSALPERRRADRLVVDLVDDIDSIRTEWDALDRDALNSLHQGLDWCRIWAKTQNSPLHVIRGRQGGKTVFLLPLELVREGGIRQARFPGGRFNNINTGVA